MTEPLSLARLYQLRLTLDEWEPQPPPLLRELLDDALLVRGMFTWQDVDWLREHSAWMARNHPPSSEPGVEWYDDLADRLASILPPRVS